MSPEYVAAYVLDSAVRESVPMRIRLYRGLASMTADDRRDVRNDLIAAAEALELAEQRHAELSLHFTPTPGGAR